MTLSSTASRRTKERGVALIAAISISLLLMAASAFLISTATHRYSAERARSEGELAYQVAESGLDIAFYEMQINGDLGGDGIGSSSGNTLGGQYSATVDPEFLGSGTYTIQSVGTVGQRTKTMQRIVTAVFDQAHGVIGLDEITISGDGGLFDSYDSSSGSYLSQVVGDHAGDATIGSNGNIVTSMSGNIYGDANPGPGMTFSGTYVVSGSSAPATDLMSVDPYVYTPPGVTLGPWTGSGSLTSGTYRYSSLAISGGDTLTISGTVVLYVDQEFTLSGGSEIVIAPGSMVVIHHGTDDFSFSGGGIVNQSTVPMNLQIFSASTTTIYLDGASAFFGRITCADADFTNNGGGGLFGSIIAKTLTFSGGSQFHQDQSSLSSEFPTLTIVMNRGW